MSRTRKVGRGSQSRRTRPNDRNPLASTRQGRGNVHSALTPLPIGDKTLQSPNGNGFPNAFQAQANGAFKLTLLFLGTNPPAYGWEQVRFFYNINGRFKIAFLNLRNESGYRHTNRASFYTRRVLAIKASFSFKYGLFFRVTKRYFAHIPPPNFWFLRGRLLRWNSKSLFYRHKNIIPNTAF
jgi:hypothetical protein